MVNNKNFLLIVLLGLFLMSFISAVDATSPTYANVSVNNTEYGQITLFSINITDDTALHPNGQYVFSTNNTGIWTNESAINFTTTPSWTNVTKTLNTTVGTIIGYRWYFNDTLGNTNSTPIYTLTAADLISPIISIVYPTNITYSINVTNINYTVIEDNPDSCWYSNVVANSSLVTSGINFTMILVAENFNTWIVWCNDTSNNLASANISFTLNVLPTSSGAVDTSGNVGTYDIVSITLDDMNITFDIFYFNNSAYVYFSPIDNDKKIVNLTNITITLIGDIQYEEGQIIKLEDGRYKKAFTIFSQNISEFTVSVVAIQGLKTITKDVVIPITEDNVLQNAKNILSQGIDFFKTNWLIITIISILMLFIIILFIIVSK